MTRLIDADSIPWEVDGVGEIPVITKEEIDDMPTVDAVSQWIPCSERLPSSPESVLCDDAGYVTIGYYTDEEIGWHDMHSYRIYPNAWMPLPTPYERKEE